MRRSAAGLCAVIVLLGSCAQGVGSSRAEAQAAPPDETPITFTASDGQSVEAFEGRFEVPENRANPDSRMIPIVYVRFPATANEPGSPIVYLAGGPGGSGIDTARGRRFPLFMAMRQFGDVIALDQRGTGRSKDTPTCVSSIVVPADEVIPRADEIALHREAAEACGEFWAANGVDVAGYTTVESVQDLDALRMHLGAEKISLWGISYGSHLALAALKDIDGRLDRVVIASAEGLDQTAKLPASTDAYFGRLQAAIDTQPDARAVFGDVEALIRGVHAKLDADPVRLELAFDDGATAEMLLTSDVMRSIASGLINDPQNAALLLQLYAAAYQEIYPPIQAVIEMYFDPRDPITLEAMPLAMDVASGIGDARLALWREQAETALLGDHLNFPMPHLRGVLGLDLGEEFRERPVSDVPTLLLTGTLDGRTYIEEQTEAVGGLTDLTHVMVVNAGHNLFMSSPEVTEVIEQFMRGDEVAVREIIVPLPSFAP